MRITGGVLKGAPQFLGRAEREATVAEQKGEIFRLPGFVEDRGQSAEFFLQVRRLSEFPRGGWGPKQTPFFP